MCRVAESRPRPVAIFIEENTSERHMDRRRGGGRPSRGRFFAHFVRGFRQEWSESNHRALMALHGAKEATHTLATLFDGTPAYAFAPPRTPGRDCPIGWLWWRTEQDADGRLVQDSGWAFTYRGARRAVGAPTRNSSAIEVMVRK